MVDMFLSQHKNHMQVNFQGKTKLAQVDSDDDDDDELDDTRDLLGDRPVSKPMRE